MVFGAVLIEKEDEHKLKALGVKDSKLLTPSQREYLEKEIMDLVKDYVVLKVSANEIDEMRKRINLNVIEAEKIAEIINILKGDEAIVDAPQVSVDKFANMVKAKLNVKTKIISENKADLNHPVCAAGSILAKVERDRQIRKIEKENNIVINTGYPHDPVTIAFLKSCRGKYPDFVRRSWETAIRIAEETKQRNLEDY
jgi:ribonuclease HII